MKKQDRELLIFHLNCIKYIIKNNNLLNKKDICWIINELIVLKLGVMELRKNFTWDD